MSKKLAIQKPKMNAFSFRGDVTRKALFSFCSSDYASYFLILVGIKDATIANIGPITSPAQINKAATPRTTK